MPKFIVKRSLSIEAPVSKVFETVKDFKTWKSWSPWIVMEPETKVEITNNATEIGAEYRWEGTRTGAGKISHTDIQAPNHIEQSITFLKPWKSTSRVWFDFAENGAKKTTITWGMEGSLPWFMFWMKNQMVAWIGMDYVRGLYMLKDLLEKGSVKTKTKLEGVKEFPGFYYIGKETLCPIQEVGPAMEADFEALEKYMKENQITPASEPFSIYVKYDMVKGTCHYISGFPVAQHISVDPPFMTGIIPETKAYRLTHSGSYTHLGNAWSTGMSLVQNKMFKQNKRLAPFEIYKNDPKNTAPDDLITQIYFPAK